MSLTSTGFSRPTLVEIKTDLDAAFTEALGPINTNADSVIGEIIGVLSASIDDAYQALQNTYDAMYPATADGTSLDGSVSFVGLSRIDPSPTLVTAACYGTEGTLISSGSVAQTDALEYSATSDVVITRAACVDATIEVSTLSNSASYQVIAGGNSLTYTSDSTATKAEITAGLAALVPSDYVAVSSGDTLRIYSADGVTPFALTIDEKLTITRRASPVVFVCAEDGANVVPVGALNSIVSAVSGWDEVYNLAAGDTGDDAETDTELRLRHANISSATGSATVFAIRSRMLSEVDGVTGCQIYENRTSVETDGIPAHAFETVVQGGSNSDIAEQLWATKPAGIETAGNVSVTVTDSNGDGQIVKFSRATDKFAWVRVTINALNTEETPTANMSAAIKTAVYDFASNEFTVGKDIITQKLYGPVYDAVEGLGQIVIESSVTDLEYDTPVYTTSNVTIGGSESPMFDSARITIIGA